MKKRILAILLTVALVLALGVTAGAATHTVVAGDNLSKLAGQYLGDTTKWKEIYEANKDIISNPNVIYVGQELVIPGVAEPEVPVDPENPEEVVSVTPDVPLKEVTAAPGDADYIQNLYATELYNFKVIINIPYAYETEGWNAYTAVASGIGNMNVDALSEKNIETMKEAHALRLELVQVKSYADAAWMLWDEDNMPTTTPAEDLVFVATTEDNSDFVPHLVPYLYADQEAVKGNVILIAGGGMEQRNNTQEAYPVAEKFAELGYNCFILQRRVAPYNSTDIYMDMQRAVRYIRYYADELGLGGLDMIAAAGFSGGGATIVGAINNHYGDILPSIYDADYVPDEIDQENSDLDVAMCVYGIGNVNTENPNLPAFLLIAGADDFLGTAEGNMSAYSALKDKTIVELYTFAKNPHGFGPGTSGTTSVYWTMLADAYMQQIVELNASQNSGGMFPAQYTKYQTYTVAMPYGDQEVTLAVNDEETEFYMAFTAFGDAQVLTGTVDNGTVTVLTDAFGMFTGDAPLLYSGADPDAWKKVPVNIPAKYTKKQTYTVAMPYGDQEVTCAVDPDVTEFYMAFTAFGGDQVLTGTVDENGIVTVLTDAFGMFTGDAQLLYSGTEGGTWESIIPYKYTKVQTYTVSMAYGEQVVNCAMNDDETEFYLFFTAFGDDQILTGTSVAGSVLIETDNRGMFGGDAQLLLSGAQSDAWVEIER